MATKIVKDEDLFEDIKSNSNDLKSKYSQRNNDFETYEKMYLIDWNGSFSGTNELVKATPSPSARNKILGAKRLLTSQEPRFTVKSNIASKQEIEIIENQLKEWWKATGSVNGRPFTYELIGSALLYDETHTMIQLMDDYLKWSPDDRRVKKLLTKTPVLFETLNPRFGYPEFDALGLCAYYRETKVAWSYIRNVYGKLIDLKNDTKKLTTEVTLKKYWDTTNCAIWYDDELLYCGPHDLPCIPVNVTISEGSQYFEDVEDTRQPLLYGLAKSKLWERENLALTTLYTMAGAIAYTPTFVYKHEDDQPLKVDIQDGVQFISVNKGDDLQPLTNKGVYTKEAGDILQLTNNLIDASTMNETAFGSRDNGSANFSESSLLAQSARLPLITAQRTIGFAIGSTMEIALTMLKEKGINFKYGELDIKGKDIPDDITVECHLDILLQQEKLQAASTGATLISNGIAPKSWVRENIMGISNNEQLENDIVSENINNTLVEYYTQKMMTQLQQQDQQQQQQQQQNYNNQNLANQQAVQQGQDMGGSQNVPVGQQLDSPTLMNNQNQAMMNNLNTSGQPQMPEGQDMGLGGVSGGLPSEMAGLLPGTGQG